MKRLLCSAGILLTMAFLAVPAYADDGNKGNHGGNAPEASIALILPAAAASAVGVRAFLRRGKQPK